VCYQRGELLRLRGEFEAAEESYREASKHGREPQPGLALLRLAQGKAETAAAAIGHVVSATRDPMARARYLPAAVEIRLAIGDHGGAAAAARDLAEIAEGAESEIVDAMAAHALGAVHLAAGAAHDALQPLRAAFATWQSVGAPYIAARIRVVIADALQALGDEEGAELERDAARAVFEELGASPDLARLEAPTPDSAAGEARFGLTDRELEVLRLIASGRTNAAIARELFLSVKTVDRHVSNIFTKLDVPTRSAATAFAYQHKMI
jgi:DNA-binding NarL/FixJ family response regulator